MKEKAGMPINQEEISHYLKDIRKIKVMTPERERQLSERILSGNITEDEIKKSYPPSDLIWRVRVFAISIKDLKKSRNAVTITSKSFTCQDFLWRM